MLLFVVVLAMFDPCVHMLCLRLFNGDEPVFSYARSFAINFAVMAVGMGFATWSREHPENWAKAVSVTVPVLIAYVMTVRLTLSPALNAIPVVVIFLAYKAFMLHFCGDVMDNRTEEATQIFPTVEAEMPEWLEGKFWFSEE